MPDEGHVPLLVGEALLHKIAAFVAACDAAAKRQTPDSVDAAMFLPVDHPHIEPSTVATLAARFYAARARVIVPTHAGEHGHPVCIARPLIEELLALVPQAKASDVIHRHVPQTEYVEVDDPAVVGDVDDPAAYTDLLARYP